VGGGGRAGGGPHGAGEDVERLEEARPRLLPEPSPFAGHRRAWRRRGQSSAAPRRGGRPEPRETSRRHQRLRAPGWRPLQRLLRRQVFGATTAPATTGGSRAGASAADALGQRHGPVRAGGGSLPSSDTYLQEKWRSLAHETALGKAEHRNRAPESASGERLELVRGSAAPGVAGIAGVGLGLIGGLGLLGLLGGGFGG
jgi:hypothetical protein